MSDKEIKKILQGKLNELNNKIEKVNKAIANQIESDNANKTLKIKELKKKINENIKQRSKTRKKIKIKDSITSVIGFCAAVSTGVLSRLAPLFWSLGVCLPICIITVTTNIILEKRYSKKVKLISNQIEDLKVELNNIQYSDSENLKALYKKEEKLNKIYNNLLEEYNSFEKLSNTQKQYNKVVKKYTIEIDASKNKGDELTK